MEANKNNMFTVVDSVQLLPRLQIKCQYSTLIMGILLLQRI